MANGCLNVASTVSIGLSPLVLRARQLKTLKDYHWMPYNGAFSRDFSLPSLFALLLPSIGAVSFSRRFEMHLER